MIDQAVAMLVALYDAIGPGLLLVAALPVLLIGLVLVTRAGWGRVRRRA